MNLPVELAGHRVSWRFPGSSVLEELFAAAPWASGGAARIVRIVPQFGPAVAASLGRAAKLAADGLLDLHVICVPSEKLQDGLEVALSHALRPGADPLPPGHERTYWLADWLTNYPTVVLAGPAPAGQGPSVFAEALELHDRTVKKDTSQALTALILDTVEHRAGGNAIDLTAGWPIDPVLPAFFDSPGRLWRAYLHARIAWETAGDLSRAANWSLGGFAALHDGDDAGCEGLLNKLAEAGFKKSQPADRKNLLDFLTAFLSPTRSRGDLLRRADDLARVGLLWRPESGGWPQPVPWAARAVLASGKLPAAESLLRGCLICRPLARELQGRCLDLEARERAVCWIVKTRHGSHVEADKRWREYSADPTHHARVFYPAGCPAEPGDSWPFTTFGEFLYATDPPQSRQRDAWYGLLNLRNGLAHNHYLCWRAILHLIDVEAQLEP